jgi:conjugal transfer pilus assembly protein TraE
MDLQFSQGQAQRVRRQRNGLALAATGLAALTVASTLAALTRDRQVVLQPVLSRAITLTTGEVSREYLELVTRDASVLMLNRTPESAPYWMGEVLKIAHPSAYGQMRGELIKLLKDERGRNIAQYFTMEAMKVDPATLRSEVRGVLHTMVGREEVSARRRRYRFDWDYTGMELRMIGFSAEELGAGEGPPRPTDPSPSADGREGT